MVPATSTPCPAKNTRATSAPALRLSNASSASSMASTSASITVVTSKPRRSSDAPTSSASFGGFGSLPWCAYAPLPITRATRSWAAARPAASSTAKPAKGTANRRPRPPGLPSMVHRMTRSPSLPVRTRSAPEPPDRRPRRSAAESPPAAPLGTIPPCAAPEQPPSRPPNRGLRLRWAPNQPSGVRAVLRRHPALPRDAAPPAVTPRPAPGSRPWPRKPRAALPSGRRDGAETPRPPGSAAPDSSTAFPACWRSPRPDRASPAGPPD